MEETGSNNCGRTKQTNKAKVEFGTWVQAVNCFAEHKVLFHCGKDMIYNLQDEIQSNCKEVWIYYSNTSGKTSRNKHKLTQIFQVPQVIKILYFAQTLKEKKKQTRKT